MTLLRQQTNNGWAEEYRIVIQMLHWYMSAPIHVDGKRYKYDLDGEIIPYYK